MKKGGEENDQTGKEEGEKTGGTKGGVGTKTYWKRVQNWRGRLIFLNQSGTSCSRGRESGSGATNPTSWGVATLRGGYG